MAPTRFLSHDTRRSGEQAALGADLLALMDALRIKRRSSVATTGVVELPVSSPRYGQRGWSALLAPEGATTFRTLPPPPSQRDPGVEEMVQAFALLCPAS